MNIGRYRVIEQLGVGGMGAVYRAHDDWMGREVAVKWIAPYLNQDPSFAKRFQREIQMLARLESPHIVPIYDVGEHEGRPFLVMRYMAGGTLAQRIGTTGLDLAAVLPIVRQIGGALEAAHAQQIIHRDIKPVNILFDDKGEAFLSDFGIARLLNDGDTQLTQGGVIGTLAYISPEQLNNEPIDGRSDQYALAIVVFEALTGRIPFEGNTAQLIFKHLTVPRPDVHHLKESVPAGVNTILQKALAKQTADRYPSIMAFVDALEQASHPQTQPIVAQPISPKAQPTAAVAPPTPELDDLYQAGLAAMAQANWPEAVAAFEKVAAQNPRYRHVQMVKQQAEQQAANQKTRRTIPPPPAPAVGGDPRVSPRVAALHRPDTTPQLTEKKSPWWRTRPVIITVGLLLLLCVGLTGRSLLGNISSPLTPTRQAIAATQSSPTPPPSETPTASPSPQLCQATVLVAAGNAKASQAGAAFTSLAVQAQLPITQGSVVQSGSGKLSLVLADGGKLFLAANSELGLNQAAGCGDKTETVLQLNQGRMVIDLSEAAGHLVTVRNPLGGQVSSDGGLVGVAYQQTLTLFEADCFAGPCTLHDIGGELSLGVNQYSRMGAAGVPSRPEPARADLYCQLTDKIACPTATPAGLPSLTPSVTWTPESSGPPRPTNTPLPAPTFTPSPNPSSTPSRTPTLPPNPTDPVATATPTLSPPTPTSTLPPYPGPTTPPPTPTFTPPPPTSTSTPIPYPGPTTPPPTIPPPPTDTPTPVPPPTETPTPPTYPT